MLLDGRDKHEFTSARNCHYNLRLGPNNTESMAIARSRTQGRINHILIYIGLSGHSTQWRHPVELIQSHPSPGSSLGKPAQPSPLSTAAQVSPGQTSQVALTTQPGRSTARSRHVISDHVQSSPAQAGPGQLRSAPLKPPQGPAYIKPDGNDAALRSQSFSIDLSMIHTAFILLVFVTGSAYGGQTISQAHRKILGEHHVLACLRGLDP